MSLRYQSGLTHVAGKYLYAMAVPFTRKRLAQLLEEHPFYPSLFSLKHVFDQYGVDNEAFRVTAENLDEFVPPYIAYYRHEDAGADFVLVTHNTGEQLGFITTGDKTVWVPRSRFLEGFQQVVFAAESNTGSREPGYEEHRDAEKKARKRQWMLYSILALAVGLLFARFFSVPSQGYAAAIPLALTKLAGVIITLLLLVYETGHSSSLVKNICTAGKQFNCDAVLNSAGSRVWGISWGDAGSFYFAATTLFLLVPGVTFAEKIPWLALAATLVSPYVLYSVYYQWRVVRQWCPLCLAVQVILLAELVWAFVFFWQPGGFRTMGLTTALLLGGLISMLLPLAALLLLKPLFRKAEQAGTYQPAYKRLLNHPETIKSVLAQQETAPDGWQQLGIQLGNPNAPYTLLKVCNPYCGPCSRAHARLEEVLHQCENVNVRVVFTSAATETDRGAPVVRHLLALYEQKGTKGMNEVLDDWYLAEKKDYPAFAVKYPLNGELNRQDEKIEQMYNWCKKAGIHYTPTIFINGRRLPDDYDAGVLRDFFKSI